MEGKWRLNQNRLDFRPRADAKLLADWGDSIEFPEKDLAGQQRKGACLGAPAPAAL